MEQPRCREVRKRSRRDARLHLCRLLGQEASLVQHGGGNTSVKVTRTNLFGEQEQIFYVKGSGWDLATIEPQGFAPVKMDVLTRMARLESLTDSDMVREQKGRDDQSVCAESFGRGDPARNYSV